MHKRTPRDCPPLRDARERGGADGGEFEVVGGAHGKVGEDFEVADAVGAELEFAGFDVLRGVVAEGFEVGCLDGARKADASEFFLGRGEV